VKLSARRAIRVMIGAILGVGFASLAGCGTSGPSSQPDAQNLPNAVSEAVSRSAPVPERIVTANNRFALNMLAQLRANASNSDNVFISPTSLALALEIVYNGARGETQTEMAQALQLQSPSADTLNNDNAALQASLVNPDPDVTLNIANSLWLRSGSVKPEFSAVNQNFYGSEINDIAGAPANVNAWVNRKTSGKIATILPDGDYGQTIAILVNAIYFNATWTRPFDLNLTADAPFTPAKGSAVTVKMMHGEGSFAYFKGPHFQALRLPYGTGRLNMILVLPDSDSSLDSLLKGLTTDQWSDWASRFEDKTGDVAIPKVTSSYGVMMNDTLKSLGMVQAFDPNRADFSGLAQIPGANVYLQGVFHKTFLRIDEKGTEAAAATGVTVGVTSAPVLDFRMTLNRPFLCAVQDERTGVILFLGTIVNPSA